MNPDLGKLHPYPFEKLAQLFSGLGEPCAQRPIALSIGEPQHPTPALIRNQLVGRLEGLSAYPTTRGTASLREAIGDWTERRFRLPPGSLDPNTQILPVNGTREALFAFAQAVVNKSDLPLVAMPNPFYQIYEGAALLAGAEPYYLDCVESNGYFPDFDAVPASVWQRCQLLYLCSPGNPTGAVIEIPVLQRVIELAERFDFVIAADECYSEIYADEQSPPPGLLQAAAAIGNTEYRRCVIFHSLSKRSNAPGLRSGFVAGDAGLIEGFFRYRTYHGCAMPLPTQAASEQAWRDEAHVAANRALYRDKFAAVGRLLEGVLPFTVPHASFYLWPRTPIEDTAFARQLRARENVTVLPGSFLSRSSASGNPGTGRVRIALVPPIDQCIEAAERIRRFALSL